MPTEPDLEYVALHDAAMQLFEEVQVPKRRPLFGVIVWRGRYFTLNAESKYQETSAVLLDHGIVVTPAHADPGSDGGDA
jgi:hypothetical protein